LKSKLNILYIADYPNWAFHNIYRSISLRLNYLFDFNIYFTSFKKRKSNEKLLDCEYDLVWLCYPTDKTYLKLKIQPKCLIKEVASWRWKDNFSSTQDFIEVHLADANYIACPSKELFIELSKYAQNVVYMPNGVEDSFFNKKMKSKKAVDSLRFGWVGNSKDPLKNFHEVKKLKDQGLNVKIAENLNLFKLRDFYQTIDVLLITSQSESQPLPFLEALSSGCSVVSRPVGIVPEFKSFNNVVIVPFEESISEYIKNANLDLTTKNQKNDLLDLNSWDKITNIYKYFFTSAVNEKVDFNLLHDRYPNFDVVDSERCISMSKYKVAVYLDWLKYGNTKIV
jgi:glycosyltransferase involved in cell wall biosynthesis